MRFGATKGIGVALEESMKKWVLHSFAQDESLKDLLAGEGLFTDGSINKLLALPTATDASVPVKRRAGLLLHPGFLASLSHDKETAPILRGAFIGKRVACAELVQPDLDLTAFPVDASLPTTRARTAAQTAPAACAGCHKIINPLGFAFEGYDQLGRPRAMDNGAVVDTSGAFEGLPVTGTFKTAEDMLDSLLPSATAREMLQPAMVNLSTCARLSSDRSFDQALQTAAAKPLEAGGVEAFLRALLASTAITSVAKQ